MRAWRTSGFTLIEVVASAAIALLVALIVAMVVRSYQSLGGNTVAGQMQDDLAELSANLIQTGRLARSCSKSADELHCSMGVDRGGGNYSEIRYRFDPMAKIVWIEKLDNGSWVSVRAFGSKTTYQVEEWSVCGFQEIALNLCAISGPLLSERYRANASANPALQNRFYRFSVTATVPGGKLRQLQGAFLVRSPLNGGWNLRAGTR